MQEVIQRLLIRRTGGFVIALHEMPPERLSAFVEGMYPAQPVHLDELVRRRKAGKSCAGLFAITVDDGVGDNVRALTKLFRKRHWPATFYLPTAYLDTREPMPFQIWWRLKPHLPRRKFQLQSGTVDLSNAAEFRTFAKKVEAIWYSGRLEAYRPVTLELAAAVIEENGVAKDCLNEPAPISWTEVREIARDGLVRFESHGVSHTAMSALTESELEFEMRQSQREVQDHTGWPCRHLCYPFGSMESIGSLAPRVAQRFYDSAVTMILGSVDGANPWMLPRIPLYPKNSLLMARTKLALKCRAAY
jgi:peptidoglycan/xylan/chitin deacetylase (PgdA/CDA1 family)